MSKLTRIPQGLDGLLGGSWDIVSMCGYQGLQEIPNILTLMTLMIPLVTRFHDPLRAPKPQGWAQGPARSSCNRGPRWP